MLRPRRERKPLIGHEACEPERAETVASGMEGLVSRAAWYADAVGPL